MNRILNATLFSIIWLIVSFIINKVAGYVDWFEPALIGAIGGFFGFCAGYRE